jgi:ankyrin repeat protein
VRTYLEIIKIRTKVICLLKKVIADMSLKFLLALIYFILITLPLAWLTTTLMPGVDFQNYGIFIGIALLLVSMYLSHMTFKFFTEPPERRIEFKHKKGRAEVVSSSLVLEPDFAELSLKIRNTTPTGFTSAGELATIEKAECKIGKVRKMFLINYFGIDPGQTFSGSWHIEPQYKAGKSYSVTIYLEWGGPKSKIKTSVVAQSNISKRIDEHQHLKKETPPKLIEPPAEDEALTRRMKLENALATRDVKQVKALLKEDLGLVNTWTSSGKNWHEGMTALSVAARIGQTEIAELLIDHKAEVNAHDAVDFTPLHWANNVDVAKLLIDHGAEVNAKTPTGYTPLHAAVITGDTDLVELLIAHGAEVNAQESDGGHTPLYNAAGWMRARTELVRLLLAHGADANIKSKSGWTPLHEAARFGYVEIVKLLLVHGSDVNARTLEGHTPLQFAQQRGHKSVAELLRSHEERKSTGERPIEQKSTIIQVPDRRKVGFALKETIPIFAAVKSEDVEQIKALLKENPELVNTRSQGRATALHFAVSRKHAKIEVTHVLLAHGADVNAQQDHGETPLYMAASWGNLEVVELLLAHGADINMPNKTGYTSLIENASSGKAEMVELLLANGAEVNARIWSGDTALQLALLSQLRALRSDYVLPPGVALNAGYKLLLANGANINNVNDAGSTALHSAAGGHFVEIVKVLIEKGADVNAREIVDDKNKGETPLHLAVAFDSVKFGLSEYDTLEIVKVLIEKGADVNARTSEGFTPLQLAENNHYPKVAELLRKHGGTLGNPIESRAEPAKPVQGPPKTIRHEIGISESPETWAERLKAKKDFRALAAINNSKDYSPAFQKFKKRDIANQILMDAGAEAVDAIMQELDTEGVGSYDLAKLLVRIGDPKAVPILKKKLDRGLFSCYNPSNIERFIKEHQDLIGEVEMVTCALCGKTRPVTETQLFYDEGRQVKRFCKDTCWQKRGRVLKSGIGTDCPFYSEGMCTAGGGDSLCSLKAGSYFSCHVYAIYK